MYVRRNHDGGVLATAMKGVRCVLRGWSKFGGDRARHWLLALSYPPKLLVVGARVHFSTREREREEGGAGLWQRDIREQ